MKKSKVELISLLALLLLMSSPVWAENPFLNLVNGTRICFSHIAIVDGWETEIAVINPTAETVNGSLAFFDQAGNRLGEEVPVTLKPHGRYEAEVGAVFGNRGRIEYMIFSSSVYGIKGYSKFYNSGIRASIMASEPQKTGLFTKIETSGWTGIAFVNTASTTAHVTLTAYDNDGILIAEKTLEVAAGNKVVNIVENIFAPQPVAGATYVSFVSDQNIVGFFLNGSSDNALLDGSKAL